jgi:hypothetical protein
VGAYTWRGVEGGAQDPGLGRRIGGGAQRSVGGGVVEVTVKASGKLRTGEGV